MLYFAKRFLMQTTYGADSMLENRNTIVALTNTYLDKIFDLVK